MGKTSWNGQIYRALKAIDHIGESKYDAKQAQGWKPGEAVEGIYSFGTFTTVFKRAITYTNWLVEEYPGLQVLRGRRSRHDRRVSQRKSATCQTDTVQTIDCHAAETARGAVCDELDQGRSRVSRLAGRG